MVPSIDMPDGRFSWLLRSFAAAVAVRLRLTALILLAPPCTHEILLQKQRACQLLT